MNRYPLLACSLALLASAGCTSFYRFTDRHGIAGAAAPTHARPTCEVLLHNARPGADYEEIGTLDVKTVLVPDSADWFMETVRPTICEHGGSLVVPEVNWRGQYLRGIVFKRAGRLAQRGN